MTTLNLTALSICPGGDHLTVNLTVNSGTAFSATYSFNDLQAPVTTEEKEIFVRLLLRLYKLGKTKAAARTGLFTGVEVIL